MNDHLLYFMDKLSNCGAKYWIDSGTLLGLYRDKSLLPLSKDCDIDLSMFYNKQIVNQFISSVSHKKYRLKLKSFRNELIDCKIVPRGYSEKDRFVELKMYRQANDIIFNPQKVYDPDNYFSKLMFKIHKFIFRGTHRYLIENIHLDSFLWKKLFNMGEFIIPFKFVENLTEFEVAGVSFPAPSPIEDYLAYRYGKDWGDPEAEWEGAWVNDGATNLSRDPARFFEN